MRIGKGEVWESEDDWFGSEHGKATSTLNDLIARGGGARNKFWDAEKRANTAPLKERYANAQQHFDKGYTQYSRARDDAEAWTGNARKGGRFDSAGYNRLRGQLEKAIEIMEWANDRLGF